MSTAKKDESVLDVQAFKDNERLAWNLCAQRKEGVNNDNSGHLDTVVSGVSYPCGDRVGGGSHTSRRAGTGRQAVPRIGGGTASPARRDGTHSASRNLFFDARTSLSRFSPRHEAAIDFRIETGRAELLFLEVLPFSK